MFVGAVLVAARERRWTCGSPTPSAGRDAAARPRGKMDLRGWWAGGCVSDMFGLAALDLTIVAGYFALVLGVGVWMGRQESDTRDFVLGGRRVPWLAVLFSIIATEISAVTFLSVPGVGFSENLNYLQFGLGSIAGRFVVAFLFIPAFYRHDCLTVYAFLQARFGHRTRYAATALFIGSRLLGSALRLSLAAIGFKVILGVEFGTVLVLFTGLAIAYTFWGGIKAVIWTDVVQAIVFIGGGLAAIVWLTLNLGVDTIVTAAQEAGRLDLFRFGPAETNSSGGTLTGWFNDPGIFYLAFLNGMLMTTASLGTDQDLTQRVLTCRRPEESARSLVWSGLLGIPVAALFLLVGVCLFAWFQVHGSDGLPLTAAGAVNASQVFAHFIGEVAPVGLRGFLLVGVFAAAMSSIDSAMSALSSSAIVDLYRPLVRRTASERHYVMAARIAVVLFGLILMGLATLFRDAGDFLWLALQLAGIPAGVLLGIFLSGLVNTGRGRDDFNLWAMLAGLVCTSLLFAGIRNGVIGLAWPWIILVGTTVTFGLSQVVRPAQPRQAASARQ